MSEAPVKVLVFSDDRTVREAVRLALGRRLASDLPEIELFEVATQGALLRTLNETNQKLLPELTRLQMKVATSQMQQQARSMFHTFPFQGTPGDKK